MTAAEQRQRNAEQGRVADVVYQLVDDTDGSTVDDLFEGVNEEWGECDRRTLGIALYALQRSGEVYRRSGRYYRQKDAR